MKKAIILGVSGFVGNVLARHLASTGGYRIAATKMPSEQVALDGIDLYDLDILDSAAIRSLLGKVRSDCIFHLAAQSSVALSWQNPSLTIDVNVKGSVNVLEAVRCLDYSPRILLIGSGEEYGPVAEGDLPIGESTPLHPANIYAATKACQNMIGKIYADAYGMDIVMVRSFNHIGPGQSDQFVVSNFCRQVAAIEKGHGEPVIFVGNLDAVRDFTDVRDIVTAYGMLMEKGVKGETYNVGSGESVSIRKVLDLILSKSAARIDVRADPARLRPSDVPAVEADIAKLVSTTGWKRRYSLEKTMEDTLDYWRQMP